MRLVNWCASHFYKANLLPDHFDSGLSSESVESPLPSGQESSGVSYLDFDPNGASDSLGMFDLFLKRTAAVLAPSLRVVFRWFVRLGCLPTCWRQANVTPIKKGPPSSDVANY